MDPTIGEILIGAMSPIAVEVALAVQQELQSRLEEANRSRHTHVERARHDAEIDRLLDRHCDQEIAAILNERGYLSEEGLPFSGSIVRRIIKSHELKTPFDRLREAGLLTLREIASLLDVSERTVNVWKNHGLLVSHE